MTTKIAKSSRNFDPQSSSTRLSAGQTQQLRVTKTPWSATVADQGVVARDGQRSEQVTSHHDKSLVLHNARQTEQPDDKNEEELPSDDGEDLSEVQSVAEDEGESSSIRRFHNMFCSDTATQLNGDVLVNAKHAAMITQSGHTCISDKRGLQFNAPIPESVAFKLLDKLDFSDR